MITAAHLNSLSSEIARERDKWLNFWMATIVPPVLVRWVNERKNLDAVARYLQKHRIHLVNRDGLLCLMHGEKRVATLEIKTTRR